MVTEIKIDTSDVNFSDEMQALIHEDRAAKTPDKPVSTEIQARGEAASKISTIAPAQVEKAHESALEKSQDIDMHEILARQIGMDYVDLDDYPQVNFKVLRMIPPELAKKYKVFPLEFDHTTNSLTLAISNPSDPTAVDDLRLTLGCTIKAVLARESDVLDQISEHYGIGAETIGTLLDEFSDEGNENVLQATAGNVIDLSDMAAISKAAPVVKLTDLVLLKAINDHASDIHIEPFEKLLRIRYRVDGMLREMDSPPQSMQLGLISRLKVMSNLDIAETRLPQDGRINLRLPEEREVELRVTSVPTVHGESIVMRVLDKSVMQMGVDQIGMSQEVLEGLLANVRKPNGIVLVTGPTGCGKTTTLYAAINEIKDVEDKLITTEDPVEYQVDGIVQVNINESVGLTYGACLRSILRQDPDKILVGEIRDLDTARISVQAALTGHLVFSTLHTNSAAGTVTRLIDMGVEPFLITGTLQAVLGQRLVRTICPSCKSEYTATDDDLKEFGVLREDVSDIPFYHGDGCEECAFTGYKGRMGLFEFLPVTEAIQDLILEKATTDEIHARALREGMSSLRQDGWFKIIMGLTTFSEVASHSPAEEILLPDEEEEDYDSEASDGGEDNQLPGLV